MSCSPFDLKDYFLQELTDPQRHQVEAHVRTCALCHEEMDRLQMTQAALLSLRDEEIPQRIAFVSDKIFEPSPLRRWWSGFCRHSLPTVVGDWLRIANDDRKWLAHRNRAISQSASPLHRCLAGSLGALSCLPRPGWRTRRAKCERKAKDFYKGEDQV